MRNTVHRALFGIFSLCYAANGLSTYANNDNNAIGSTRLLERRIVTSFSEERRGSSIFQTARSAALFLNADLSWNAAQQSVRLSRGTRSIVLRRGVRVAVANGVQVSLPTAPYLRDDALMIPIKIAARALAMPLEWNARTDSLLFGPVEGTVPAGLQYILPLVTDRTGFVIHSPKVGEMVATQVRVQLQANIPPGKELVLQMLEADGSVLKEYVPPIPSVRLKAHPTRGQFTETIVFMGKSNSSDGDHKVRFVAFLRDASQSTATLETRPKL